MTKQETQQAEAQQAHGLKITVTLDDSSKARIQAFANVIGRTFGEVAEAAINAALHGFSIDETLLRF